jgi:prophage antirepressor-like protein
MNPTVFQFDSAVVRTFANDKGEPWFSAKDVCNVLGYINDTDAVKKHCREGG